MASEYKSAPVTVAAPIEQVFARYSNLENLKTFIDNAPEDKIPADKLEQLRSMEITQDTITVQGGPTGAVTLRIVERKEPELVVLRPDGIPIPLDLELRMKSLGDDSTEVQVFIEADIPMMLRPMVKGPLQQMCDQLATMLCAIPF